MPPSIFEKIALSTLARLTKEVLDRILGKKEKNQPPEKPDRKEPPSPALEVRKSHPWRICPIGEHWRRTHPRKTGVSESYPDGSTTVRGHCVRSPRGKEVFHPEELREIAKLHFEALRSDTDAMPSEDDLGFKEDGLRFDTAIAGWTKFWNEVLEPKNLLDPDWVKALIASESGFRPKIDTPSTAGVARGLIQITENTRNILRNTRGELKNHYLHLEPNDFNDPNVNLAAGIRWLHHKKKLLEHRIKREATW